eukprot:c18794_g1_i3.p1 GENE.c18794_g1_i3~~c18794_g1_i3.p1  ORF type:complete len:408 (+),score=156.08 c18794_g1_i3:81-1304(+)
MPSSLSYLIGVGLCTLSAVCSVIGVNVQKTVHNTKAKRANHSKKSFAKEPLWWFGFFLISVGALFDFLSMGFAPQTVVSAMGSMTLVINTWTAPLFLKEKLTKKVLGATVVIMCGAVLVVINASNSYQEHSVDDLLDRFKSWIFFAYAGFVIWVVSCLLGLFLICERSVAKHNLAFSERMHSMSIASLSGILGAQSLLFAKAFMTALVFSIENHDAAPFLRWETYFVIFGTVGCVYIQTYTLNIALARFDTLFVYPIFQVCWTLGGVLGAGVFYQEFSGMKDDNITQMTLGFLVLITGICFFSKFHKGTKKRGSERFSLPSVLTPPETESVAILEQHRSKLLAENEEDDNQNKLYEPDCEAVYSFPKIPLIVPIPESAVHSSFPKSYDTFSGKSLQQNLSQIKPSFE